MLGEYDLNQSVKDWIIETVAAGYEVRFPEKNQLFIDIDTEAQYDTFLKMVQVLTNNNRGIVKIEVSPSKSGLPKQHAVVTLDCGLTGLERVTLQACLGSDPVREYLSYVRILRGVETPTIFQEAPGWEKNVIQIKR